MINKMIALDWRAMKYYQIRWVLLPSAAFVMGIIYTSILVIPLIAFLSISFSVNPFAVEEKGELNNLYLTLPIKRNQIVTGRYGLSLIILFSGILLGIPIMLLANTISFSKWYVGVEGIFVIIVLSFFLYSICNLCMFPILFKLGYQKGKLWGFYIPAIMVSLIIAGFLVFSMLHGKETYTFDFIVYVSNNLILVSGGLIILSAILLIVSYLISIRLYSKRNF